MRYLSVLCCCVLIVANSCKRSPAREGTETCSTADFGFTDSSAKHPRAADYNALAQNLVNAGIPGLSIMIQDSAGLWYGAYGTADIEKGTAMQPCHGVKIASITKLFTATMVYKMIDAGKMQLSDPISKYIDAKIISRLKNSEKATIADLLQHSSGINDFVFNPDYILYVFNNLEEEKAYEKLLSFSYDKEPAFEYNTKRQYNYTVGYILLAMAINKAAGKDHALMQRELVFDPLQMNHTFFRPVEKIPWNTIARGYFDYRRKGIQQDLTPLFTGDGSGFTGIYSTTNDLRKFMNALYRDKTVISNTSLASMMSAPNINDSISYGVGCRIYGVPKNGTTLHWYGHPGGEVNYASGVYYCPEKNATVVYILNYGDAFEGAYSASYLAFRRAILQAL
jgi:D-alanyl-D-alanine carboxypeptidase